MAEASDNRCECGKPAVIVGKGGAAWCNEHAPESDGWEMRLENLQLSFEKDLKTQFHRGIIKQEDSCESK